jgi:hypothetical protein
MIDGQYWLQQRFKKKTNISPIQAIKTEFHLDDEGNSNKRESFSDAFAKLLDEVEEDEY